MLQQYTSPEASSCLQALFGCDYLDEHDDFQDIYDTDYAYIIDNQLDINALQAHMNALVKHIKNNALAYAQTIIESGLTREQQDYLFQLEILEIASCIEQTGFARGNNIKALLQYIPACAVLTGAGNNRVKHGWLAHEKPAIKSPFEYNEAALNAHMLHIWNTPDTLHHASALLDMLQIKCPLDCFFNDLIELFIEYLAEYNDEATQCASCMLNNA